MSAHTRVEVRQVAHVRSVESRAFEAMWLNLRRGAMIPQRSQFDPRFAIPFLKNIVLVEAPQSAGDAVRLRLIGTACEARAQKNITGTNYLDYVPEEFHAASREAIRLLFAQPCGLWQIVTAYYERMFAEPLEITSFPLLADSDHSPVVISFVKPVAELAEPNPKQETATRADAAPNFEFLDVGAGIPHWPPRR